MMRNTKVVKYVPLLRTLHASIVYQKIRNKLLGLIIQNCINLLPMLVMLLILLKLFLERKKVRKRRKKNCKIMDYLLSHVQLIIHLLNTWLGQFHNSLVFRCILGLIFLNLFKVHLSLVFLLFQPHNRLVCLLFHLQAAIFHKLVHPPGHTLAM